MGFFKEFKEDASQAMKELMPGDDILEEEETEDDYSDESDAEVEEETDEFEGLAIYSEDDFE